MDRRFILGIIIVALLSVNLVALTISAKNQNPKDNILQVTPTHSPGNFNLFYKSESRGPLTLMIFDITGKYVFLKNYKDFNGELKENIDLNANPKGIYIFEVEGTNSRETKKIVFQ
jgi:hypothetical protein